MSVPYGQPPAAPQPGSTKSPLGDLGPGKLLSLATGGLGLIVYLLTFADDVGGYLRTSLLGFLLVGGGLLAASSVLPKAPSAQVPAAVLTVTGTLFLLIDVAKGPIFSAQGQATTPGLVYLVLVLAVLESGAATAAALAETGMVQARPRSSARFPQQSWSQQPPGGYYAGPGGGPGQGGYPGQPPIGGSFGGPGGPGAPGHGAPGPGGPGPGGPGVGGPGVGGPGLGGPGLGGPGAGGPGAGGPGGPGGPGGGPGGLGGPGAGAPGAGGPGAPGPGGVPGGIPGGVPGGGPAGGMPGSGLSGSAGNASVAGPGGAYSPQHPGTYGPPTVQYYPPAQSGAPGSQSGQPGASGESGQAGASGQSGQPEKNAQQDEHQPDQQGDATQRYRAPGTPPGGFGPTGQD